MSTSRQLICAADLAQVRAAKYAARKRLNAVALTLSMLAMVFGVFWLIWILWETIRLGVVAPGGALPSERELALRFSVWQVDRDIAAQEKSLEKIITARDRAVSGLAAIERELALRPPAGQVELMALVSGLMRGSWQLQEWKLLDADNLQVTAQMTNPDPRAIVAAWEASKRFTDVTAELGKQPNSVVVKAHVVHASGKGSGK